MISGPFQSDQGSGLSCPNQTVVNIKNTKTHERGKAHLEFVLILNKIQCTHKYRYERVSLQQQQGGRGLFGGLLQCKKADLTAANETKVNRGSPQELLLCQRGPTNGMAILNKSG